MRAGDNLTFKLPGFYCQEGLNITLDEIKVPSTRVRLIVNGDEFLVEEGEEIADSGCQVQSIEPEQYGYGGTVQITCQGSVYSGKGTGDYELSLAPKNANLNIQDNIPTKGSSSTREVTLGDEIKLNVSDNNEYKFEYYYVAHIGKAAASGKSAQDVVILFASRTKAQLDQSTIRRYVQAFQKYLSSTNKPEIGGDFSLKDSVNKDSSVGGNIGYVKKIEKGIEIKIGGQQEDSASVEVLSVEGPRQVTYSASVETAYKAAISQYRSISNEFLNQKDLSGRYYGVKALRAAQELAHFMSKEDDEIDFLQEIIDQYQDNPDEELQYEVESAREDIVSISQGSGNKFTTVTSGQGTYYVTLVSIDKPGYNSQEATLKVDGSQGTYLIGDTVGDWALSEIKDDYVTFITSGKEETISKGSLKFLGIKKVQLVSTYLKKEAKVTFWPFEKERTTTTNFSVVIGISKRSIQLTPDQIQKKIRDLNKTIETLDKYVNALEKITTAWKKVCYVGGTVLWTKNLLEGFSGTPMARSIVMKAWTLKCASEAYRTELGNNKLITVSQCYLKNKASINTDVSSVKSIINEANDFVKSVKSKSGVVISSGLLGLSKQINDEKFILEAKNLFSSDSKAKALIDDVADDIKVSVPVGRLNIAQKGRITQMLNDKKITEAQIRGNCSSNLGVKEMLAIQENNKKEYTKEVQACIINVPVHVKYVMERLDELADQGLVSVDDIKELYLILAINKKVNSDPESISEVLRDYNNINVFSKFDYFESILLRKENRDTLSGKWGFDIQFSESENTKKPLTYNSIPTIDSSVIGRFSSTDIPSSSGIIRDKKYYDDETGGKPYMVFSDSGRTIFAILEPMGSGSYNYIKAFKVLEDSAGMSEIQQQTNDKGDVVRTKGEGLSDDEVKQLPRIIEQDFGKCGHAMAREDYQIKFWESEPYEGMIAYMPILRNEGWYYATKAYSGFENKLVSYKETGQVNEYWICNVGENGKAEFNFYSGAEGDDCGCTGISKTTTMDVPDDKKELVNRLEKSGGCIEKALKSRANKESPINAGDCGKPSIGKPPVNIPSTQCEEFMSPEECSLMYNLCDPVICPPSRCDFGGRFPVENVIQTGIIGSLVLCSSNTDVTVPICITGLYNGLDSLNNMVFKQYRQCLQKQIDTGQTTGLCDYWHSVYFCQLLWNNLDPFIKAGIPLVTSSLNTGGGEYALFSDAFKSSQDSLTYFTQNYGPNAFTSFKEKSVDEKSTSICDRYLSIRYPTVAKFFDDLTKADSYYQVYASVDEIPMGGGSPESHYRVFYTIYAGRDQPLSYQVYLKKKINAQSYSYEREKQYVRDATGFLAVGQTVSNKADIIAPAGYTEICININGKDECGFGTLSTSFAVQELQNVYLQDQIKKNIKTQKECQAGSATIIPTASFNIQSQLQEALQPEIYRRGIIRICASDNPSGSVDSTRYQRIGYCDNEKIGCWLDMSSVNDSISDLGIVKDVYKYAEQSTITHMLEKEGYDLPTTSQDKLLKVEQQIEDIQKDANVLIESINQRFSSDNPAILNPTGASSKATGSVIFPLTGMVTENYNNPPVEALIIPSNINSVEVQDILDKYSPQLISLTSRIDPLVKELKTISDKCISIEEKSRAQWDIAILLELKSKLKSQVEVALTNLAIIQGGSCAGQGGNWYDLSVCPAGYKKITDATDNLIGSVCCAQVLGKFEEFTEWYTDNLKILNKNVKTDALTLGDTGAFSPGKGRVIKADTGLKLFGAGNREFIIQYADNLFIKYTVSGGARLSEVITKGKILTPGKTVFRLVSFSPSILTKTTPGGQVIITAYVNNERDPRNPLCFFTTEKLDEIKKANPKISFPTESECAFDRQGIKVEGVIYGTTAVMPTEGVEDETNWQWHTLSKQEFANILNSIIIDKTTAQIILSIAIKEQSSGENLRFPDHNAWGVMANGPDQSKGYGWGFSRSQWTTFRFTETERSTNENKWFVGFPTYQAAFDFMVDVLKSKSSGYSINYGDTGEGFAKMWYQKWGPNAGTKNNPPASENSELKNIWNKAYDYIESSVAPSSLPEYELPDKPIEITFRDSELGVSPVKYRYNRGSNGWELKALLFWNSVDETLYGLSAKNAEIKNDLKKIKKEKELKGYEYFKQLSRDTSIGTVTGLSTLKEVTKTSSQSGTQTPPVSSADFDDVLLYSNVNNGVFDSSNVNNLVDFGDSVRVCAVIEKDGRLYSSSEVSSKNSEISSWTGTTPTFEWYKIEAYQSPLYSGATNTYSLPAAGTGTKNDVVQYKQTKIAGSNWCIDQKSIDSSFGTYWYRAQVKIGLTLLSSLGEPADSSDISALQSKLPLVTISKYTSRIITLLKPNAMENYAISPSVLRISRKSNYDTTICTTYGYQSTDLRCQFISILEAFKNLPFVHGCGEYNCGQIAEPGTSCSTNPVSHLAEEFIAVDCLNLMLSALEQTTGKSYDAFNDFNTFISDYGTIKNNVNELPMNGILNTGFNFGKDKQVEIGDILFMYAGDHYIHTLIIYNDADLNDKFNGKDYAVYASNSCPGPNPLDPSSQSTYAGNLCYAPFARYASSSDGLKYTMVKIKDLG